MRTCSRQYFTGFTVLGFLGKGCYPHIRTGCQSATWYNREESHSEQFIFCINCSFSAALNLILHLRIISFSRMNRNVNIIEIM